MGRASVKPDKNIYFRSREKLELSREKASSLLEAIEPDRLERIENEKSLPRPEEVLIMSERYKAPELRNYYCTHDCPIGIKYMEQVQVKDLSQIVLETIASLNRLDEDKARLVEITVDGQIDDDELKDFAKIQNELETISATVEALKLWGDQMIAAGKINVDRLEQYRIMAKSKKK